MSKLYRAIAIQIGVLNRHADRARITELVLDKLETHLPSGSGFDNGTRIDREKSTENKLVLHTAYHHMDDVGGYDGWTEHTVTVAPSLVDDFDLRVSGRDRDGIKEYIAIEFSEALAEDVPVHMYIREALDLACTEPAS